MIPWPDTDTVLLDMDGTLLDLHFDTHFWLEHVPRCYAAAHGVSLAAAREHIMPRIREARGTLEWYCVEHWSRELELDIAVLKREVAHLIRYRPQARAFLRALRHAGKSAVLVTNAHPRSLELKLERTDLGAAVDVIVCAHELGVPKEQAAFWHRLRQRVTFDPARSALIDDNLRALGAARAFGIATTLAVRRPDSRAALADTGEFDAVARFADIMPSATVA